jgi:hypothetical protein
VRGERHREQRALIRNPQLLSTAERPFGRRVSVIRYAPGVVPVMRRNTVVKWLTVRNPVARAIAAIESSRLINNADARSIRRRTTNWCGGRLVLRLKSRAK